MKAHFTSLLAGLTMLLLAASGSTVMAQTGQQAVIEIVRLQHRDPAPIRTAIEPFLDERGAISQIDRNLIISTSRENLARLQTLIAELDVPLRQLRISVDFHYGQPATPLPASSGNIIATTSTVEPNEFPVQSIVITEGEFAHFSLRSSTPVTGLRFAELGLFFEQQFLEQQTLEPESNQSERSISLTAEPRGTVVSLAIATVQNQVGNSGRIDGSVVNSTLEIPLNQWYVVTTTNPPDEQPGTLIVSTAIPDTLAVRVELLP